MCIKHIFQILHKRMAMYNRGCDILGDLILPTNMYDTIILVHNQF